MKRRRFISAFAAAPVVPALLVQEMPAQQSSAGRGGVAASVPRIAVIDADEAADTVARFFSPTQLAALKKLAGILVPPVKGNIGALECDSVEFVDFLISSSPADRQLLYKNGLDYLNASARKQFGKSFAELETAQAD